MSVTASSSPCMRQLAEVKGSTSKARTCTTLT